MKRLKYQQLALPTVEIFLQIEEQILLNAAKKLRTDKSLLDGNVESWQMNKLSQLGALEQETIILLAKNSHLAIDEVSKMLKQAGYSAVDEFEPDLVEAVRRGILARPANVAESRVLLEVLKAYEHHSRNW